VKSNVRKWRKILKEFVWLLPERLRTGLESFREAC
jgi:hypothetical protein